MSESELSFEQLVVTAGNELAVRAARAVAETPGVLYNPLIIQGPKGVGKTHLLHTLAAHSHARDPGRSILLESADRLVELVTEGVARGSLAHLRRAFAGVDLLLIDDFDGLMGMERTRTVLVETFEALLETGRQIVLTTRTAILEDGSAPRLRDLLAGGLLVEVEAMDSAGRTEIIRRLAGNRGIPLDEDSVRLLATSTGIGLGELDGLLAKLEESSARTGAAPGLDELYTLLEGDLVDPEDEFGSFLEEVTETLSAVVETEPWRRRIAAAILHWESQGIRTARLERVLGADSPPDVDGVLESFARDAGRLLAIRAAVASYPGTANLDDPDALHLAEGLLRSLAPAQVSREPRDSAPETSATDDPEVADPHVFDPSRVVLDWVDVAERIVEGSR